MREAGANGLRVLLSVVDVFSFGNQFLGICVADGVDR
jgi:hypothetical protein